MQGRCGIAFRRLVSPSVQSCAGYGRSARVNTPSERLKQVHESCFEGVEKVRTKGLTNVNSYMIQSLLTTCSTYNTIDTLRSHVKDYLVAKYHLQKAQARLVANKFVRFGAPAQFRDNDVWNQIVSVEWQHLEVFWVRTLVIVQVHNVKIDLLSFCATEALCFLLSNSGRWRRRLSIASFAFCAC